MATERMPPKYDHLLLELQPALQDGHRDKSCHGEPR